MRLFELAFACLLLGCSANSANEPSPETSEEPAGSSATARAAGAASSTGGNANPTTTTTGTGTAGSQGGSGGSRTPGGAGDAGHADAAGGNASPDGGMDAGFDSAVATVSDAHHISSARIACVGDSITVGLGSTDQGVKSYPSVLQALLGTSFHVENDGHSGATMLKNEVFNGSYWTTSEFTRAHAFSPDIVIITLGTNDMNIYDWPNHDQFAGDYAAMIDDFRALASHPVVYVGLPPWVMTDKTEVGLTEDRMSNFIIPAIRGVAANKGTPIIDFHALTKDHPEYYHDEIHPNDAGYAAMAAAVRSAILQ